MVVFRSAPALGVTKMIRNLISALVLCVAVTVLGCEKTEGVPLPLPAKAKEVKHFPFEGGGAIQTNYLVDVAYPDLSVGQFYFENVKTPWIKCFEQIPTWDSFGDSSNGKNRFVHQVLMHWINREEKKLLLVTLHYYSSGTEYRKTPENAVQYVSVVQYEQDPEEAIKWLKLKCKA